MSRNRRKRPGDLSSAGARQRQLVRLYAKYEGICQICLKFCPRELASRDHVIELCLGGTNDDSNMVLAHQLCNERRSRKLGMANNQPPPLPLDCEKLPSDWWESKVRGWIRGAIYRQAAGIPVNGKVPPRLVRDSNFYSSLESL